MKIEVDEPVTLVPADEPLDDAGYEGHYAVQIFISLLILLLVYLRFA